MELKRLLVLDDFTEAANIAAAHSYQIAILSKAEVISLHVVSEDEDIEWAKMKCKEQIQKIENYDASIPFTQMAAKLNLFKGMNKWLEERKVDITFMATHGKKDIQFITGSHALKLIFNAETPTLVVQHKTPLRPYKHVLLPVFVHHNDMQFPENALQAIGSLFKAALTLLTPATKDEKEKAEIQKTVERLKSILQNNFISISVHNTQEAEKNLDKALSAFVQKEKIDLIALVIGAKHHREKSEKNKKFIQTVITNEEQLPVLCL